MIIVFELESTLFKAYPSLSQAEATRIWEDQQLTNCLQYPLTPVSSYWFKKVKQKLDHQTQRLYGFDGPDNWVPLYIPLYKRLAEAIQAKKDKHALIILYQTYNNSQAGVRRLCSHFFGDAFEDAWCFRMLPFDRVPRHALSIIEGFCIEHSEKLYRCGEISSPDYLNCKVVCKYNSPLYLQFISKPCQSLDSDSPPEVMTRCLTTWTDAIEKEQ